MSATIFKWTREKYIRNSPNSKWKLVPDETEVTYCTELWMQEKTGKEECSWWRALGAYVRVKHIRYSDSVTFTNIRPDKLEKREERFDPIYLTGDARNMGYRENDAMADCYWHQRCIPIVENTDEHIVLGIGEDEHRANLDIKQMRWV